MNLEGERRLPARIEQAWAALNDPQALKACITGCESMELTGEDEYTVVMAVRIGPVNARFKGRLRLLNVQPPSSYTIDFDGQGGVAGFGKGSADVVLTAEGEQTVLRYTAKAQVGGKIAQIGSRLVDSAANKVAGEFFTAFEKYLLDLATTQPVTEAAVGVTAEGVAATAAEGQPERAAPAARPAAPATAGVGPATAAGGIPWGWVAIGAAAGSLITWLLTR
jgi:carbon monoxide dehydrogenase subunit G